MFLKKKIIKFIDWYIHKNYSAEYIHKSMIKNEISLRIKNAIDENNKSRDEQEQERLNSLRVQHKITVDGFEAELEQYKKVVKDAKEMRKNVEQLYFKLIERIKTISVITVENKHEGLEIINSVSTSIGRLDKINMNILDLVDQIENNKQEDLDVLRIKQID